MAVGDVTASIVLTGRGTGCGAGDAVALAGFGPGVGLAATAGRASFSVMADMSCFTLGGASSVLGGAGLMSALGTAGFGDGCGLAVTAATGTSATAGDLTAMDAGRRAGLGVAVGAVLVDATMDCAVAGGTSTAVGLGIFRGMVTAETAVSPLGCRGADAATLLCDVDAVALGDACCVPGGGGAARWMVRGRGLATSDTLLGCCGAFASAAGTG